MTSAGIAAGGAGGAAITTYIVAAAVSVAVVASAVASGISVAINRATPDKISHTGDSTAICPGVAMPDAYAGFVALDFFFDLTHLNEN